MSSKRPLVSDLVCDSKIDTEFLGSCIRHVFHEAGHSLRQRLVRREERWVRQRYLGQGAYGTVYLEKREDGSAEELRAVKELKKSVVAGQELDYARELEAIMKFSHPRYRHCFVSSSGWYEHHDSVFITMEFLELGDLQRYLTRPLPESQGQLITKQTLEGLSFMHDNGFIHRDLKPANIMVVTKGPNWFVKIADFGISRRRHQDVTTLLTLQRGTLGFAAPEALGGESDDATYSFSVDMWSLGAVAYRILTNASAFLYLSDLFRYASGILDFPEEKLKAHDVSELGRGFIIKLMQPVPEARLSAAQAMLHPWFTTPLATVEDPSSTPHSASVEEEPDITDISMASKAWSSDDQTVSIATKKYHHVEDLTVASMTPSPENLTMIVADRTARPLSESNYKPPLVEDCPDDDDESALPRLASDSKWVLELESDLEDGNACEGSATHNGQDKTPPFSPSITRQDSLVPTRKYAVPLDQVRTIDAEKSIEAGSTDEETEYESDTDSGPEIEDVTTPRRPTEKPAPEREEATTPQNPVENTQKEPVKSTIVSCKSCSTRYEWEGRQIEYLPCQHYICHACLLQYLALSLISPKHMPARCCDDAKGEIKGESFGNIIVDPRINDAWETYRHLKDHDDWRCPRGHPPKDGSLPVTFGSRYSPPIWNEVVKCSGCLTETLLPGGAKEQRPTSFCLLCSSKVSNKGCHKCEQNSVVWPFIRHHLLRTQETHGVPTSWLSSAVSYAARERIAIRDERNRVEFQTLAQLKRLTSLGEEHPESEEDYTESDSDNDYAESQKPELQQPEPPKPYPSIPPRHDRSPFQPVFEAAAQQQPYWATPYPIQPPLPGLYAPEPLTFMCEGCRYVYRLYPGWMGPPPKFCVYCEGTMQTRHSPRWDAHGNPIASPYPPTNADPYLSVDFSSYPDPPGYIRPEQPSYPTTRARTPRPDGVGEGDSRRNRPKRKQNISGRRRSPRPEEPRYSERQPESTTRTLVRMPQASRPWVPSRDYSEEEFQDVRISDYTGRYA